MKIYKYIITLCLVISCKAQSPEISSADWDGIIIPNSYLKDMNNDLNAFEGTYVFTNNDTIFKIKLRKMLKTDNGPYYQDMLIGEFEYKVNGVTLLNTLSQFDVNYLDQTRHRIHGGSILSNSARPVCSDCVQNEKRVRLSIYDTKYYSGFILKRIIVNGVAGLRAYKYTRGPISVQAGTTAPVNIIRDGEFIFIKQP